MLLASRRGVRGRQRRGRELVHVCDVGIAPSGTDDPREDAFEQIGRRLGSSRWLLHPVATLWRRLLRRGLLQPDSRIGRLTAQLHTPFDALERASDAVARGNLRVFEEIGLEFARWLEECAPHSQADAAPCLGFLDRLRPGDPPEGQRYLRQAFAHYQRCRSELDPKARAELAVLANVEIGFHEQTRLQPEIRAALDAASATEKDLGAARSMRCSRPRSAGGRSSGVLPPPSSACSRRVRSGLPAGSLAS